MAKDIRIVIVDDHPIVRMGLKALLEQHPDIHVVGEASIGEDAVRQALRWVPDVVIMDIQMPGMVGMSTCHQITQALPETRVILFTSLTDDVVLLAAVQCGVTSYILKGGSNTDLIDTIRRVAQVPPSILDLTLTRAMFKRLTRIEKAKKGNVFGILSLQELRILVLIAHGLTNREIAERLFLGNGTVRNYVSTVLGKLHLINRTEAAAFATQHSATIYLDENWTQHPGLKRCDV